MSKKLQLSIATPCHENWDGMTPVEKACPDDPFGRGKFCGSCQKQVLDFSDMSDRQIAEFFKKPSTGSVCGRFMQDQLDRDLVIPKKRIPWLKYFFQIVLPAFLLSVKASAQTKGKARVATATTDTARIPISNEYRTMGMVARPLTIKPFVKDTIPQPGKKQRMETIKGDVEINIEPAIPDTAIIPTCNRALLMGKVSMPLRETKVDTIIIKGKITDEEGNGISGAGIVIKGTLFGVVTNDKGEFSIKASPGWNDIILETLAIGFETKDVSFAREDNSGNINIGIVALKNIMMGEISYIKDTVKKEIKPVPLIPDLINNNTARFFTVYPNPVLSGSSLSIDWKQTEEGYYILQLIDQSGKSVNSQEIWIDGESRFLSISIPSVAAGTYFLRMTNKSSGKHFTEKVIIQ